MIFKINPAILPWIVLFCVTVNIIFLGGTRRTFGNFIAVLHKEFSNMTLTELNWVGDTYAAFGFISSVVSTALIIYCDRKYGLFQIIGALFILSSFLGNCFVPNPRWLFFTHTFLNGIGSSLILSVLGLVIIEYFEKNHPYYLLATTLFGGPSLSGILFISPFAFIIKRNGWRMAFVILGVIYFVIMALPAIIFEKNEESALKNSKRFRCNKISMKQIPLLVLWCIDRIIGSVVTYGLLMNLTDFMYRTQSDIMYSTILTTLFAIGEGSSYVFIAFLTCVTREFFKNKLCYIILGTSIITCISLIAMEFTSKLIIVRRFFCFTTGFTIGFSNILFFPGGEELTFLPGHIAYPFTMAGTGLGMLISPLLTAKIADIFRFKWFFLVQGFLVLIKVICLIMILFLLFLYDKYELLQEYQEVTLTDEETDAEQKYTNEKEILLNKR